MIQFPALTELQVYDYGLFPGAPHGQGINWSFQPGLSLIAGINGLGKTTLLTMILRAITGPYDLSGDGAPQAMSVSIPAEPVALRGRALTFFSQRVADGAQNATVRLAAEFGPTSFEVTRNLRDLSLVSCSLEGIELDLPSGRGEREARYQDAIAELMGVGSFVDVLLLLHHVVLFQENRPGALWDVNAQRQILRALFLEKDDATRVALLERLVQSTDSQARNVATRITATENDLAEARRRESGSQGVVAQIEAEQKLLDAEMTEAARLNELLQEYDEERQQARLEHEKAKIEKEEAAGSVERLKYSALLRLYPSMDDAARLILSRIMTDNTCLVCHAEAGEKRAELEKLIAGGCCPACGAPPNKQDNVIAPHEFEQAKFDQALQMSEVANAEEQAKGTELRELTLKYDRTVTALSAIRASIEERKRRDRRLRANLPQSTTSRQFEDALVALRTQLAKWMGERAGHLQDLRGLLNEKEDRITAQSSELLGTFVELSRELLSEEAKLVQISSEPRYTQAATGNGRLSVPAYAAEMSAANRPGLVRRQFPEDVSESQRELIDLAFRLALVRTSTGRASCTFVMETPEASLDGLAMNRVGAALASFAAANGNRLVVSSNLSNAGLITALFGGAASNDEEIDQRRSRVLNLLEVAAPNRALQNDLAGGYSTLLENAISGRSPS